MYTSEIFWAIVLILSALIVVIIYYIKKNDAIVLKSSMNSEQGYTSIPENLKKILYAKGKTLTPMNPSGVIEINGVRFDAQSRGEFIEPGTEIEVIGFDSVTPIVKIA